MLENCPEYCHSKGSLNQYMNDLAEAELISIGHDVQVTVVNDGYDIEIEIEKWLWADVIIYQMPGWWMGAPWIIKKYMDEVFTIGHGRLYTSDGRSRYDSSKKYGSGGLLHGKKYMISLTWNAPAEAFTDPNQLFEGVGVDGAYIAFHKAHEFLDMTSLPTYICHDVIKVPNVEQYTKEYKEHLNKIFG